MAKSKAPRILPDFVREGSNKPADDEEKPSFLPDILTILVAALQRRRYLILTAVLSVLGGFGASLLMGSRVWEAEAVLLYKPSDNELADEYEVLQKLDETTTFVYRQGSRTERRTTTGVQLQTLINTVKIPANLERVRSDLNLAVPLGTLGAAIQVRAMKDTELILIKVEWPDAKLAQSIANLLVKVFVENNSKVNQENMIDMRNRLSSRFDDVSSQLKSVQQQLSSFSDQHKVIDLQKESEQYIQELIRIRGLRDESASHKEALTIQLRELEASMENLKDVVEAEAAEAGRRPTVSQLESRIAALTREVEENRSRRSAMSELLVQEAELERVKMLNAEGLASNAELERAHGDYAKAQAAIENDASTSAMLKEIDELRAMIPSPTAGLTASEQLLRELELRRFEIQLALVEAQGSFGAYELSVGRVQDSIDDMPALNREFARLSTKTAGLSAEVMGIERMLAEVTTALDRGASDFRTVSEAPLPLFPSQSNRRLLLLGGFLGLLFLTWGGLLMRETLDTRIRSVKEAEGALDLPVLGAVPVHKPEYLVPDPLAEGPDLERYRIMALQIRKKFPAAGGRIQIVSGLPEAGKSLLTGHLAQIWGRSDERVLILEAETRKSQRPWPLSSLIASETGKNPGLSGYLSYETDSVSDIVKPTILPGVDVIDRGTGDALPDLLGSQRFCDLLDEVSAIYSLVLVDSPAILDYADSAVIHPFCQAAIYVLRSRTIPPAQVRRSLRGLENHKVMGLIMTDVPQVFMGGDL